MWLYRLREAVGSVDQEVVQTKKKLPYPKGPQVVQTKKTGFHIPRDRCQPACHCAQCSSSQYDAYVIANSIPVMIVSAAKSSMSSKNSYSSLSTGQTDDSWLILDSLNLYMIISTHY